MANNDPVAVALGALIRNAAEDQGLAQGELAKRSGIHRVTLYRYLDGDRDMPLSVLTAIAGVLNIAPDGLIHDAIERARRDSEAR